MIIRERTHDVILSPKNVKNILTAVMDSMSEFDREKEHFFVFGLDTRNQIKYLDVVSVGTLNYNLVHPREVFRLAVHKAVASIIIAHNHPSGSLEPSDEDLSLTKRLAQAGDLLGIELLDHVIVADGDVMSFKVKGLM